MGLRFVLGLGSKLESVLGLGLELESGLGLRLSVITDISGNGYKW